MAATLVEMGLDGAAVVPKSLLAAPYNAQGDQAVSSLTPVMGVLLADDGRRAPA